MEEIDDNDDDFDALEGEFQEELQDFLVSQQQEQADDDDDNDDDVPMDEPEEEEVSPEQLELRRLIAFKVGELLAEGRVAADKGAVLAVAELTRQYAATLSRDLEAFADHGRRKQFGPQDVLLSVRRNPNLHALLKEQVKESVPRRPKKKRTDGSGDDEAAPAE